MPHVCFVGCRTLVLKLHTPELPEDFRHGRGRPALALPYFGACWQFQKRRSSGTAHLRLPSKLFITALAYHREPRRRSTPLIFRLTSFQISGSNSRSPNQACPSAIGVPSMPLATSSCSRVSLMKPRMPLPAIPLNSCSPRLARRERFLWEMERRSMSAAAVRSSSLPRRKLLGLNR